jgi:hypothetical protein
MRPYFARLPQYRLRDYSLPLEMAIKGHGEPMRMMKAAGYQAVQ